MSSLEQLKTKWFINLSDAQDGTPMRTNIKRHAGSKVKNFTDGNEVEALIDGKKCMQKWHESIVSMSGQQNCEIYLSYYSIDNVRTLGRNNPDSDAIKILKEAHDANIKPYVMLSHHVGSRNMDPYGYELLESGIPVYLDDRFPSSGSNHQKLACFKNPSNLGAIVGSVDIAKGRWDTVDHSEEEPEREGKKSTHDLGVYVTGPAVSDLEQSFLERWNDSSRDRRLPEITTPTSNPGNKSQKSIQVLHTYGMTSASSGYSWSPNGEFTIWASYLNAIQKAQNYIYIEDQYFFPFGSPSGHAWPESSAAQASDLIYQLGRAIRYRGVKVIAVVPTKGEEPEFLGMQYQRQVAAHYLATMANSSETQGKFVIASLQNGTSDIFVHSKLMICDDEFAIIGTANFNRRSMSHDSEIDIAIVDGNTQNSFAKNLRKELWSEHLQLMRRGREQSLDDIDTAFRLFKEDVDHNTTNSASRVRKFPTEDPGERFGVHRSIWNTCVDPYGGPPRG